MKADLYSGTVTNVIYEADDFRIVRIMLDDTPTQVTAKGHFPAQDVRIGTWVSFEAKWTDSQYGRQLTVTRSPVAIQKWSDENVLSALTAQGVGPLIRMGLKISCVERGLTLCELLDQGDLSTVANLDDVSQMYVLTKWRSLRTYLDGASFMADAGIPPSVVNKVWSTLGSDLADVITTDPWVLVRVAGISFKEADEVARRLGVPLESQGRTQGAVLSAVQEVVGEGHVYSSTGQLVDRVRRMIPNGAEPTDIAAAIGRLVKSKLLVADRDTEPGTVALYGVWYHKIEQQCAELLAVRMQEPLEEAYLSDAYCGVGDRVRDAKEAGADLTTLAEKALENWALGHKMTLAEDQRRAAVHALTAQVSLLTGLPGTGKTTTLRALVSILRDTGVPFLLAAPTGIAAKRMTAVTGAPASTIHRAFGAKGFKQDEKEREATYVGVVGESKKKGSGTNEGEEWGYGPDNPHPARVIVVDESSMLDLHMLFRILSATSVQCRIVFVGDPYQLPSVGCGDVLHDLVRANVFPHSHLTQIFRQEGTSGIVLAAHAMHRGEVPKSDQKDFLLIPASSERDAADLVVQIAQRLYERRVNFQVLSPRHAGDAGVTNLNQRLRLVLNPAVPGVAEMKLGGSVVREDDRIMVVKNDYNLGVYNGDVGKVARIDRRAKEIEIKIFEGADVPARLVRYPFKDAFRSLRLAYAQTVHKSQGQEYDAIVVPVLNQFGRQLQRNLYYTAITRAKVKVFLVGSASALARAVANNQADSRNTLLAARLVRLLGGGTSLQGG